MDAWLKSLARDVRSKEVAILPFLEELQSVQRPALFKAEVDAEQLIRSEGSYNDLSSLTSTYVSDKGLRNEKGDLLNII